jgi:hypothetical protein
MIVKPKLICCPVRSQEVAGTRRTTSGRQSARNRFAASALVVGGLVMTALFVPFTLAHGPTSFNEEQELLGHDMHFWGLLLGVVPNVLIGAGFWAFRGRVAGGRRLAFIACTVICAVLWLSAAMDLAFGALGAPFGLLLIAPTVVVACLGSAPRGPANVRVRVVLAVLGATLISASIMIFLPEKTSDSFGGYRIFGLMAYGAAGILWACLGLVLDGPDEGDSASS